MLLLSFVIRLVRNKVLIYSGLSQRMAAARVGGIFKDFLVSDETQNEGGFTG